LIHTLNAECLVPSTLRIVRRGTVLAMASHDPSLATDLWMRTAEGLQRAHEHMLLLGRTTAEERVVGFLLHMAARNPNQPEVDLPMTRRDIADYLGLAIETVSRTLTSLVRCAAIHRSSHRRFGLRSRAALDRVATGGHSRGDSAPLGRKPVSDIVDPPARAWTS
jgi:CRP/FNR family nitrogen fixation transcriptional regulator